MMLSLGSLGPIASSIEDHFDCFENLLQLSMELETLYLAPTPSVRRNCFSGQARACIARVPFQMDVAAGSAVHGESSSYW